MGLQELKRKKIFYSTLALYTITSLLQLIAEGLNKQKNHFTGIGEHPQCLPHTCNYSFIKTRPLSDQQVFIATETLFL